MTLKVLAPPPPDEPVGRVIEILEDMLDLAYKGRLRAVAVVGLLERGTADYHYYCDAESMLPMLGALSALAWAFNVEVHESAQDTEEEER